MMSTTSYRLKIGNMRFLLLKRHAHVLFGLLIALIVVSVLSLSLGVKGFTPANIVMILRGEGSQFENFAFYQLRLPRLICGLVAGAAFGISGAIFQNITGNDLASPDIIGLNAGAALGVVMVLGLSQIPLAVGAVIGVCVTTLLITFLSWRRGITATRFVLTGIGLGAMILAGVQYLLLTVDDMQAAEVYRWLIGSLDASTYDLVWVGAITILPILVVVCYSDRELSFFMMGHGIAKSLGHQVELWRAVLIIIAVLCAALAVYIAGPVAFVAFVSGPIARMIVGRGPVLLASAMTGSLIIIASDLCARTLIPSMELPVGLFTVFFGAPFLIFLIIKQIRQGLI